MRRIRLLWVVVASLAFTPLSAAPLLLTAAEQQWLASHPEIRLGVDPDWAPFEYLDEEGNYRGIAAEYVALLSARLGVRMVPVAGLSWDEVMRRARVGEIDLLPAVMKTPERESFLTFSPSYINYPMVIITRDDGDTAAATLASLQGKRVGVVKGYVTEELLQRRHPELVVVASPTIKAGLEALALGDVDAYLDNLASASYTIQQHGIGGLRISSHTPYDYPLAFGIRKDWPEFATILGKALLSLDPAERHAIEERWIHVKSYEGIDIGSLLAVALPIVALTLLVIATILYWNRRLRREVERRRHVEAQLQLTCRSLSDSQEIAHVGSWEWNIVSGELRWSDEIYRIFGLQPRQFGATYEAFLERLHPDDRERVVAAVNSAVEHDTPYDIVHRLLRPSGELRIVNEQGRVYHDADGRPLRMLGVVHDITSLKVIEESLRRERDTAQRYLDIAGVMLLIVNADERITLINRHGLALLGYESEAQVVGRNWFDDFLAAELREEIRAVFRQLMAGNIQMVEQFINPITTRHGEQRWIAWQNILLRDETGAICAVLSSGQDITEQRRTEERLRLSDKVFAFSSEAILITDHRNRIVTANPGFIEQTGYTQQEVVGHDPKMLSSGRHDAAFYAQMWRALNEQGHWAGEVWDRRKDGSIYPKWLSINVVTEPTSGQLTHYIAIFTDLSVRKAEEERIRYLAHHDALTGLPNRLLLQDRLHQALAKARRSGEPVALLFIDLDRFKPINDTLGHHIGDQLLQEIARRLSHCVRESDTVARLGGDEFVIVLDGVAAVGDIHRVAEKVIAEVARVVEVEGHDLFVTASIGISISTLDGDDGETLLQHADAAMYQAKRQGRCNYQFLTPPEGITTGAANTP